MPDLTNLAVAIMRQSLAVDLMLAAVEAPDEEKSGLMSAARKVIEWKLSTTKDKAR